MNWLLKLVYAATVELLGGVIEKLAIYFNNIFEVMYELQNISALSSVMEYTRNISLSLTIIYGLKQLFDTYVLMNNGELEEDPLENITRAAETVATIMCGSYVIDKLLELANTVTTELTEKQYEEKATFTEKMIEVLGDLGGANITALVVLILIVAIIIAFIIFIVKAAIRGAELILFQIMLPIIAIDKMSSTRERWKSFSNDLMLCIFGYILQVFGFNQFMKIFLQYPSGGINILVAGFAWLKIATSAPKWLEKFVHNQGNGSVMRTASNMASQVFVQKLVKR